jgi:hypothetical protein
LTSYLGYTSVQSSYFHDGRSGTPVIDLHSIISGSAGDVSKDPHFVNYGFNTVALNSYTYDNNWDFHLQAGSPALTGAWTDFSGVYAPYFGVDGLTIDGILYKTPLPGAFFGAFGVE